MEQILRDLRYGLRQLLGSPVFALVSALALGIGIGSVTTQISVINGLFLKGLPYPDADKIVYLERNNLEKANYTSSVPILEYIEWRDQQEVFQDLSAYYVGTVNFTMDSKVERYNGAFISANTFRLLGIEATLGRGIHPEDGQPESPDVTVLSHKIWTRDFGQDPGIIGKTAILNGRSVTIVGVMPEQFAFPENEDIWVPLFQQQRIAAIQWGSEQIHLNVIGRLAPGITRDAAQSAMAVIARNIEAAHPDTNQGFRDIEVMPLSDQNFNKETKTLTAIMLLISGLILTIACANVANLLLARSMRRQTEFAIRAALGATRSRILTQFLTESLLLAGVGALIGVAHAYYNVFRLNSQRIELDTPFWVDFSIDGRVLLLVIFITVSAGILAGLTPAIRSSKLREYEILKDDARTSSSIRMGMFSKVLVVLQISVTAVILTLVILFVNSVQNAVSLDYEYDPDSVLSARVGLFDELYPDEESRANFMNALLTRLRARPEITFASTSQRHLFLQAFGSLYEMPDRVYLENEEREFCRFQRVSEDFFATVQLPLIAGRTFLPEEFEADVVRQAIVNRQFAEREWPGQNPIGKRFKPLLGSDQETASLPEVEVIGLTGSMNESGVFQDGEDDGAAFFIPQLAADMPQFNTILVRGPGKAMDLLPVLREEVAALDKNLPLYSVGTPRELNSKQTVIFEFFLSVFREFGILAAFLAAVGIYGVISFSVNQRIMEFGIRQALGATRATVFKLVYRHACKQLGIGFLIAFVLISPLLLSPGLKETMVLFFYELEDDAILPYLLAFGFVAVIALLAATPPAIRAARIHPAQALRYE